MTFNTKKELNNELIKIMNSAKITDSTIDDNGILRPFNQKFDPFIQVVYNHSSIVGNPYFGQYMIVKPAIKLTEKKTLLINTNVIEYAEYCLALSNFMRIFNDRLEDGENCLVLRSLY